MFEELKAINSRPFPFERYTAGELWTNEHTSKQMLAYHLDDSIDASSRNSLFIDRSIEWIVSHFALDEASAIADFGCGPGLYTTQLAQRGARVTGIDFSRNSLDYANRTADEQGLDIHYVLANYLDFNTTDRFDLITMIMCDFCALGPEQRKDLLSIFHTLLKPEGSVLLDVYSLNSFDQREESATYELNQLNGFWSPEDYYCFVNTFKYDAAKVVLDKYTIIEESATREVYNWLQFFSEDSIRSEFGRSRFEVKEIYSNVAGDSFDASSAEMALVARKSQS
jgi:cyclopropane fatty-acyl-phospholipid synthase-like methyltransferase